MSDFFCFGGGRGLRKFVSYLRKLGWIHRIVAIVDNRSSLWGSVVTIDEYTWRVISPQELRDIIGNREIIITCMAREELQSQLAGYSELRDTTVAFYQDIIGGCLIEKARHMTFPDGLRSTEKPLIPKIIHYCWFGGAQIPAEFQRYIDGWKIICPDYEICRWDESNYDVMKNAYMKAAYGARKWAFVSDYARLDVVYQYGGFYLDTDVELVKPLDELRYNKACMGMEETDCVNIGLGFGAVPKYPAIKMLRDAYRAFRFTDFHTLKEKAERKIEPSPKLLSRELEPYGFQYDCCKLQDVCGIRIYPIPVLSGMIARTIVVTDCTYSIHHFAGTWVPKK